MGFNDGFAGNVIIFCVDSGSSSNSDNRKNNFLILGEGPTYVINGGFGSLTKTCNIYFTKTNTKFCLVLHYNADNSFKDDNENFSFSTQFYLGSISNGFSNTDSREVSLNGDVCDFSVDYSSIDKSEILNIQQTI